MTFKKGKGNISLEGDLSLGLKLKPLIADLWL
jgi:hypothetical protein